MAQWPQRRGAQCSCIGRIGLRPALVKYSGFFYHCNFAEIVFASMCLGKTYIMPFFCKWPLPGLNKQSWCGKNFSLINILT